MTEPQNPTATQFSPTGFVKGLEGIIAAQTSLSLVDGVRSRLYYRGIAIEELARFSSFEETIYLLWYGHLPHAEELNEFKKRLKSQRKIPPQIIALLQSFPKKAHPMAQLRTAVSALALYDKTPDDLTPEGLREKAIRLTACVPTILGAMYRIQKGKETVEPDPKLSHAANYLYMMHGKKPGPEMERALDAYLILLADHGLNASTFAARVTCATLSDMYSAVASAIGTLKGDLHGSANQRAMEMILDIEEPEKAEPYILNLLENKKKVMGFGHRIYKHEDPRAVAFREMAGKLCQKMGKTKWMDIATRVEKTMWERKQIPCNVDFFSASVLYILGFPIPFFTTVFAASRVAGWSAHVIEQLQDNRLIRPGAEYIGPTEQRYVPLEQRSR